MAPWLKPGLWLTWIKRSQMRLNCWHREVSRQGGVILQAGYRGVGKEGGQVLVRIAGGAWPEVPAASVTCVLHCLLSAVCLACFCCCFLRRG